MQAPEKGSHGIPGGQCAQPSLTMGPTIVQGNIV